ncbi:MAG: lipoyl(octanoyl) transferase LipB [Desulfobacterales bacterium]|nr:lipoyl(octanoyl) transferase LipB [Desulfobacterales bacterium]
MRSERIKNGANDRRGEPSARRIWRLVELPVTDYKEALDLQRRIVTARKERRVEFNVVIMVEHPPVFTLGRRGGMDNLTVSGEFLEEAGVAVIPTGRGGDITFHGPGQLVCYPIVHLPTARVKVVDFVSRLETVMIRTAGDWGVRAETSPVNRGVWVNEKKLGSLGIRVRRGVAFHGLALNVNTSLEPFGWINPCGLHGVRMTTMSRELARPISMDRVRKAAARHMEAVFGVELAPMSLAALQRILHISRGPIDDSRGPT